MYHHLVQKSLRVSRRDAKRLLRVRKAWVIVIGVLITPALYAWFNITAFWDPYSNTANIHVAVVNLDEGTTSEVTGAIDVGSEVVSALKANTDIGWEFMGEQEAREAVLSGHAYAAIVIPADFSADFLSVTTGTFTAPELEYYVNEKANAIAPKITDAGATKLDAQITASFTDQVARAATEALKDAGDSLELALLNAKDGSLSLLDKTSRTVAEAREDIAGLKSGIDGSRTALAQASTNFDDVVLLLGDIRTAVDQAQMVIAEAQEQVVAFTETATSVYVEGITLLADASAEANVSVSEATGALNQASTRIDSGVQVISEVIETNGEALTTLKEVASDSSLEPAVAERLTTLITSLEESNASNAQLLADLRQLVADSDAMAQAVQSAADTLNDAMASAQESAAGMRAVLTENVPTLNEAMSALSTSAGAFSAALQAQEGQLTQAMDLLAALDTQLLDTTTAVDGLDATMAGIQDGIDNARTDVVALSSAESLSDLSAVTGLEVDQIAQFIASPVDVTEHVMFPVETYGSAMAALFTNLALWIGAFVLVVIFKLEVDTDGFESLTVGQAYVGRLLLLAALAGGQALIVCIGDLLIGVQTVSATAFVFTGLFTSWVYLSIIYALSVALGHIGRGIAIVLVIMQIPGASGLYPIEMMPGFFRALYPFLPFTYGIDAMRETIAGFYGGNYWHAIAVLGVFLTLSFLLGLVLRKRLANLNLVFNREIHAADLLISEDVQVVSGSYRLTDMIHALSDRSEYRDDVARRARLFTRRYDTLVRTAVITGLTGALVLSLVAWLFPTPKATYLFIWLLWCLAIIGFLVAVEYISQSFRLAAEVATLDDDQLRQELLREGPRRRSIETATAPIRVVLVGAELDPEDEDEDEDESEGDPVDPLAILFPSDTAEPEPPASETVGSQGSSSSEPEPGYSESEPELAPEPEPLAEPSDADRPPSPDDTDVSIVSDTEEGGEPA